MEVTMSRGRAKGTVMPERPIVQISDKYRVLLDKYSLILQEFNPFKLSDKEEDKDSKDGWKFCGYFTTWDGVFWKLLRAESAKQLGKSKTKDIMELRKIFLDLKDEVKKMTEGIKVKYNA
jgi:hypothetical protein